jgi:hypothetical protein
MMKRLHVTVSGSHLPPATIYIQPGTTPGAVLHLLKLDYSPDCYVIVSSSNPSRDLFDLEDLYSAVEEGETLIVMTRTEAADRYILSFFNENDPQ